MIQLNAIRAAITKDRGIPRAVLRIVHISVTVHLKPVNVFLLRQTIILLHRRNDNNPLFQLVETQLHMVVNHTIITDAAIVHIGTTFIIRNIIPKRFRILWFKRSYIQTGIIGSRGKILLSSNVLYECHHTE